jgi:hypothetical protein
MGIELKIVTTRSLLKTYIFLPATLYKGATQWVPPLYADEWSFHNPKQNKALGYCPVIRFLAYRNGKPVGRIMGIIHTPYNLQHQEKTARFFNLDCINEQVVVHRLITGIEAWAKANGATKLIGPYGFSDKDPQGLQIEGFEFLPVLATPTNPAYLKELIEHEGFEKEIDCVSYRMAIPERLSGLYEKIHERAAQNKKLKLVEFHSKRALKPYILPVLRLVNEAYAHIFGFVPMTDEEMKKFAAQYLPVLDPEFVKAVVNAENTLVAFVVAMPDMSRGLQQAKGKLFPFGFIHIMKAMRTTNQLNLLLGAIKPGYRNLGISVLLGRAMFASALKRNLTIMDSHLVLENNLPMRGECEKLDGKVYKRYRVYGKELSRR